MHLKDVLQEAARATAAPRTQRTRTPGHQGTTQCLRCLALAPPTCGPSRRLSLAQVVQNGRYSRIPMEVGRAYCPTGSLSCHAIGHRTASGLYCQLAIFCDSNSHYADFAVRPVIHEVDN